ncbi:MAG: DNA topoisomerase IV subunit A [Bifidobacteriaceae bacterium]|nr:DNA topoisomerase IV subunit A [Bifidobacteriaceae bacterium]
MSSEKIQPIELENELQISFMEYALSVIHARALPDARDGLKPVQRRIIFQTQAMGLAPDKPFVKSARIVGDVMGKLHPHGDSAIYDALVRMAQPFSLRLPLIEGHGNFGSLDDSPAAARYTEARPSIAATKLNEDIDQDTVDFTPNYDNKLMQPKVLPSAFPNLLVNGSSGIAVGMTTNMAPHNLREVINAALYLIDHSQASLDELLRFVPGPDLPNGGVIMGIEGIREAYQTGRGNFTIRAKARIENLTSRSRGIVITELPYLVGPERIIERMKTLDNQKKLEGISYYKDLTDRHHGIKIVIGIKSGFNAHNILERLYALTPLQENFSLNHVALVNNTPQTLNLSQLLQIWIDHRKQVVRRRTEFKSNKLNERLHQVEGLWRAILNIDQTIAIIRNAEHSKQAKKELAQAFDLDDAQTEYILELKLRRLTKFSCIELEQEKDELVQKIQALELILQDPQVFIKLIKQEMQQIAQELGDERRTLIATSDSITSSANQNLSINQPNLDLRKQKNSDSSTQTTGTSQTNVKNLEIIDTKCTVLLSSSGLIGVIFPHPESTPNETDQTKRHPHDAIQTILRSSTRSQIGVLTNFGRIHKVNVSDLNMIDLSSGFAGMGGLIGLHKMVDLEKYERVLNIVSLSSTTPIALATHKGIVKRVLNDIPKTQDIYPIIALIENDEVISGAHARDEDILVFIAYDASLLHFPAGQVRPQGRSSQGMSGIKLTPPATLLSFNIITNPDQAEVITIAKNQEALSKIDPGFGKRTALNQFPRQNRASRGVRSQRFLKNQNELSFAFAGTQPLGALNANGLPLDLPPLESKRDASGTKLPDLIASVGVLIS